MHRALTPRTTQDRRFQVQPAARRRTALPQVPFFQSGSILSRWGALGEAAQTTFGASPNVDCTHEFRRVPMNRSELCERVPARSPLSKAAASKASRPKVPTPALHRPDCFPPTNRADRHDHADSHPRSPTLALLPQRARRRRRKRCNSDGMTHRARK